MIAPMIPEKWKGFKAKRVYRGVRYLINVRRAGKGAAVQLPSTAKPSRGPCAIARRGNGRGQGRSAAGVRQVDLGDSFDGAPVGLKFKPDDFRVLRIGREVLFPHLHHHSNTQNNRGNSDSAAVVDTRRDTGPLGVPRRANRRRAGGPGHRGRLARRAR